MQWGIGWGMGTGWLIMLFFWILVILGVVYVIHLVTRGREPHEETPLDTLKKRYAKGEVTKEEFERMKDDLMKN